MEDLKLGKYILEVDTTSLQKEIKNIKDVVTAWTKDELKINPDKFRGKRILGCKYDIFEVAKELFTFSEEEDSMISDLSKNPDFWEYYKNELFWPGIKQKIILYCKGGDISYLGKKDELLPDYDKIEFLDRITDILISENSSPRYEEFLRDVLN